MRNPKALTDPDELIGGGIRRDRLTKEERLVTAINGLASGLSDEGDIWELSGLARLSTKVDEQIGVAVQMARAGGESWGAIGAALGMSRQAAQQRFREIG